MEDSSNHATLPILGNLSSDDTEDLIRLLVTSTISTDESEKTGLLVLLALRVSYISKFRPSSSRLRDCLCKRITIFTRY